MGTRVQLLALRSEFAPFRVAAPEGGRPEIDLVTSPLGKLSAGVYVVRLATDSGVQGRKIVLVD